MDEQPQYPLLVHRRRGRRIPQPGQVTRQREDFLLVLLRQLQRARAPGLLVFAFDPGQFLELLIPAGLQRAGHHAVLGLHRVVLPLGTLGLIAHPLQAQLPLAVDILGLPLHFPEHCQRQVQLRRSERRQQGFDHLVIDSMRGGGPAVALTVQTPAALVARVVGQGIDRVHPPPTPATKQRQARAGRASASHMRPPDGVVLEALQILQVLLPGDVRGVRIRQEGVPSLTLLKLLVLATHRAFDEDAPLSISAPRIGAGVDRIAQDGDGARDVQRVPADFRRSASMGVA